MKETIVIRNLSIGYHSKKKERVVVKELNASLLSGELTCLIGANGSGKSTLLRTLSSFQPALGGEIEVRDAALDKMVNLKELSANQLSRMISVVLTSQLENVHLTVEEMVGMGRLPYTDFWGNLSWEDDKVVDDAIRELDIQHLKYRLFGTLSDGERQKVMIAKALAQQTPIIILDEPTAFLDFPSKVETMMMLKRFAHQLHKTILTSTHDVEMALQLADKLWLMDEGLSVGTSRNLADDGSLTRFFNKKGLSFDKESLKVNISQA